MILLFGLLVSLAYLVGAFPTGYWFCKAFFNLDITEHGSGNIGATNVARVLGKIYYFILIFFIDALKAFLLLLCINSLLVAQHISALLIQDVLIFASCALLVGNSHSIFLRFKGGKGVATMLGITAYLIPFKLILLFIGCWLMIMLFTRQAFLASLGSLVVLTYVYGSQGVNHIFYFLILACCWAFVRHLSNIKQMYRL